MVPQTQQQKPRNSARVNLFYSALFHGIIVVSLLYFAARQGLLGKHIKKIAVEMVKEKPPEKPKPKEPEKPKEEPPKIEPPKVVQAPKVEEPKTVVQAPPPAASALAAPPVAAPPAVDVPSFVFEGGKAVETSSDPSQVYKGLIEYSLRSHWDRPDNIDDHTFEADVEVAVDASGRISDPVWKKSSGNSRWDDSVRHALAHAKTMDRPPPAHFPPRVVVRFDVVETQTIAP